MTPTIFPRYRRQALEEFLPIGALLTGDPKVKPTEQMIAFLGSQKFRSFLLPTNGLFVSYQTPTTLTYENCCLPHPFVVLEYSMSESGFPNLVPGKYRPAATVLVVHKMEKDEIIALWGAWRKISDKGAAWNHSPLAVIINKESRIEVTPQGQVLPLKLKRTKPPEGLLSSAERYLVARDFIDEMLVLAQFSMICSHPNVRAEKIAASMAAPVDAPGRISLPPDDYYTLKCTGPTDFAWLPESGMAQSHA